MPYTHSLVGALAWSALAFALARWIRVGGGSPRAAGILALAVLSHWFLDVVVHGPDLPIYDDAARVGFGLWSHTLPAFLVEVGFLGGSIAWCLRSRQVAPTLRRRGIVVFGGVLLAVQAANSFGPIPTSPTAMVSVALCSYVVFAAVVYRLERRTCPALSPRDFRESAPARDH
jgi:membrane-bound metal-dependent hydrolase YbcI (DUF457 family)